jgi:hypothetical protein
LLLFRYLAISASRILPTALIIETQLVVSAQLGFGARRAGQALTSATPIIYYFPHQD